MCFQYAVNRKCEHLVNYKGILHVDDVDAYNALFGDSRIIEAVCFAQARRKYFVIYQQEPGAAGTLLHQALQWISPIYALEASIRGQPRDDRRRQRQA